MRWIRICSILKLKKSSKEDPVDKFPSISEPATYRICVLGRVDNGWSDFMDQPEQSLIQENGVTFTAICGQVSDQAALYGMLCRIRDLGLVLMSVRYLPAQNLPDQVETLSFKQGMSK